MSVKGNENRILTTRGEKREGEREKKEGKKRKPKPVVTFQWSSHADVVAGGGRARAADRGGAAVPGGHAAAARPDCRALPGLEGLPAGKHTRNEKRRP